MGLGLGLGLDCNSAHLGLGEGLGLGVGVRLLGQRARRERVGVPPLRGAAAHRPEPNRAEGEPVEG